MFDFSKIKKKWKSWRDAHMELSMKELQDKKKKTQSREDIAHEINLLFSKLKRTDDIEPINPNSAYTHEDIINKQAEIIECINDMKNILKRFFYKTSYY